MGRACVRKHEQLISCYCCGLNVVYGFILISFSVVHEVREVKEEVHHITYNMTTLNFFQKKNHRWIYYVSRGSLGYPSKKINSVIFSGNIFSYCVLRDFFVGDTLYLLGIPFYFDMDPLPKKIKLQVKQLLVVVYPYHILDDSTCLSKWLSFFLC